jgi:3-hydroxyacyl-CoA dehydrogenase
MTQPQAYQKRLQHAREKRAQQAKQRRRQQQRERLQSEQARAQRHLQALEQALQDLGLSETVVEAVEWRLQAQQKLLGKMFAMMFPPGVWLPQLP